MEFGRSNLPFFFIFTLVFTSSHLEMDMNWLKIIYSLNCILTALAAFENEIRTVNVLAALFPPFTYIDSNSQFVGGTDVQILKTVANRLNLKINWIKTDSIAQISAKKLKYILF